jgi:hypothetical protein
VYAPGWALWRRPSPKSAGTSPVPDPPGALQRRNCHSTCLGVPRPVPPIARASGEKLFIAGIGDFDQVRASAVEVELFGRKVKVLALEPLIRPKEAVGRPKDLLAATELRAFAGNLR